MHNLSLLGNYPPNHWERDLVGKARNIIFRFSHARDVPIASYNGFVMNPQ